MKLSPASLPILLPEAITHAFRFLAVAFCLSVLFATQTVAATLIWDASGTATTNPTDGSGTWDTSTAEWNNGTLDAIWNNSNNDTAVFGHANGTAGTVTTAVPITAGGITFNAATSGTYTIAGTSAITLAGTTPTITVNAASATISAPLAGTSGFTEAGTGKLILTGTNTYTGATVINAGTTVQAGNGAVGPPLNLNYFGATTATITLNGGTLALDTTTGNNYISQAITVASASTISALTNNEEIFATTTGSAQLNLSIGTSDLLSLGNGNVNTLSGYTGLIELGTSVGSLRMNFSGNANSTSGGTFALDLGNGSATLLDRNGGTNVIVNIGSLAGGVNTKVAGAGSANAPIVYSIGGNNTSTTFAGTIGNGTYTGTPTTAITKVGTGTLTLSGNASTYSGGTTVSGGALKLANTSGSSTGTGAIALGAATLTGTGFATGNVTTAGTTSVIAPATTSTIGTLTLGGVTANAGLTLNLAVDGAGATNSALTLSSGSFLASGGTLNVNLYDLGTNTLVAGTAYTIASGGTGWTAPSTVNATLTSSGYTLNTSYGTNGVLFNTSTDIVSFEVLAVPEPSTWVMLLGGLVLLVAVRSAKGKSTRSGNIA